MKHVHGGNIYTYKNCLDFSANCNPLGTPESVKQAVRDSLDHLKDYPQVGYAPLKEAIAAYEDVKPENIICGNGAAELVFSLCHALKPKKALIPIPTFAEYEQALESVGAEVEHVLLKEEDEFRVQDSFIDWLHKDLDMVFLCNPNNPTGYLYTRKEMNQIRDLVRKYDLFLFSDEVYREFCYTGAPYISAFHLEGIENNVILVDSVSKRYSECGIRIGALITKNKQVRENVMKWCQARLSPPLIGQIMAEASLDTPEEYMRDVYDEYVERRKFLIDGLNRIPGCYSPIPMGAFYTVARLPIDDADKFCAWCLEEFDYEGQTIFMAPASGFYTTPGLGKNEVRLAYVLKKEDLAKALVVLEKALETYNKKGKK